ncbi:MAG: carbon storage regulator [Chlamydiales bacterium]|jgi:carbon storage regulator
MLVLTRKSEQKIRIGKDITITVLKVHGDQVSIGIDAPRTTLIYREEIFKEIEKANTGGAISNESAVDVKTVAKTLKGTIKESSPHTEKLAKATQTSHNKAD